MIRFPKKYTVFTELLEAAGYVVGRTQKGANFGNLTGTGWMHDPAGRDYGGLSLFLDNIVRDHPFFYWFGSSTSHRPFATSEDAGAHTSLAEVDVPGFLPDTPAVRYDLLSYYYSVAAFDREIQKAIDALEARDMLDNTIIIVTSDNGMPFPRAKANCYDYGLRVPLLIVWPGVVGPGQVNQSFVNLMDLAPTILEAAGLEPSEDMTGISLLPQLAPEWYRPERRPLWKRLLGLGRDVPEKRDAIFVERERHSVGRGRGPGDNVGFLSYPIRGIRTDRYLYLVNLKPDLWPACDPPDFLDVDRSASKSAVLDTRDSPNPAVRRYFDLSFGKRPKEELYDVQSDPYELDNLADDPRYQEIKDGLKRRVKRWMADTGDPRAHGDDDRWDYYGYYEGDKEPLIPQRP